MSNESENKRIDLTQFDAITKGPWEVIELPGGGIDIGVRYTNHGHRPVVNFTQRMGEQVKQIERDVADMNAIAAVPDLIAKLKRCYEELDKWTNYATYVENVNMDCHQDACAEAGFLWKCTDCGAHFELPENGIYECEFGCDASE